MVTAKSDAALVEFMKELKGIAGSRPVTDEELARLLKLFAGARAQGDKYDKALKTAMAAVLCSPGHTLTPGIRGDRRRPGRRAGLSISFDCARRRQRPAGRSRACDRRNDLRHSNGRGVAYHPDTSVGRLGRRGHEWRRGMWVSAHPGSILGAQPASGPPGLDRPTLRIQTG